MFAIFVYRIILFFVLKYLILFQKVCLNTTTTYWPSDFGLTDIRNAIRGNVLCATSVVHY